MGIFYIDEPCYILMYICTYIQYVCNITYSNTYVRMYVVCTLLPTVHTYIQYVLYVCIMCILCLPVCSMLGIVFTQGKVCHCNTSHMFTMLLRRLWLAIWFRLDNCIVTPV